MKRFEAVALIIDMTNNALIPCQVMLLGHLLLHSLVRLHCLLIRLLRTASSAHALHCTHSFICSCTCYGGYELNALISFNFNPLCSGWSVSRQAREQSANMFKMKQCFATQNDWSRKPQMPTNTKCAMMKNSSFMVTSRFALHLC